VVLQHVFQCTDAVVVTGPALKRERLVPDDVDLGDVAAVPERLERPVGEPGAEQVLHRRHGQEVVDPEHCPFGEASRSRPRV
jgi:hypothetical protein